MSWKDISRKNMREDCWEHFSIECSKSKTDVITTANQKKGKYPEEPMRNQRKNSHTASSAGNAGDQFVIFVNFAYDWSREWYEFSGPITEWSGAKAE